MNNLKEYDFKTFEDIKHIDEFGNEYWLARELQKILEYTQWRRFEDTINRAKISCENSNNIIKNHFADVGKIVKTEVSSKKHSIINYLICMLLNSSKCTILSKHCAFFHYKIQVKTIDLKLNI